MEVFKIKIKRIAHKIAYRIKMFAFAHWLKMLFLVALGFFVAFLVRLEKGTFAFCTEDLVHCLEETVLPEKGIKKGVNVLKCAVKLPVCDVQTILFTLTDDRDDMLVQLNEDMPAVDLKEEAAKEDALENKEKEDVEEEISGAALFEEMERLREEREIFEKNQIEMRKKIFETLESQNKPDILSVNTAPKMQQETPHE